MTTLPALSTPCTWNTFLARSTPMVLTCIWTTPSGDSLFNDHPLAHSMPGAGVVHHIIFDRHCRFAPAARCLLFPESDLLTAWQRNDVMGQKPTSLKRRFPRRAGHNKHTQ